MKGRDWSKILVHAGINNLRVCDVARAEGVAENTVSKATFRYGINLTGQTRQRASIKPTTRVYTFGLDWDAELELAADNGETMNDFCRRTGAKATTVIKHAKAKGHVFPRSRDPHRKWKALLAHTPKHETITDFCKRTGRGINQTRAWAKRLGHRFALTRAQKARRGLDAPICLSR